MMTSKDLRELRDPLTGTATAEATRRFLEAALDLSESHGPSVVLFAVGIDGLSLIEVSHGPAVADAALLGVADRLRAGLRTHDLVGRLPAGFTVCLPEIFTAEARPAAERLRRVLEATPVATGTGPLALRCSIGLAFGRGPGSSADDLMARATAALAAAQEAGGSRIVVNS
ncbi:GGDEF domain-containing protein [Paracraurococcus lichenis]|uniref:diguanylate cyclase n=1 Tax=Paracraurococcus lichenis TaxID=3064888 RepID=A0ABT9DXK6_9PROT|nr:GGDEF domain-containing protein [Paracraurococcus sp. LOR1-02]MDO9708626.1 GGDEF domain-containing protein [Paracraurococcus sp. LOR1-02]